MMHAWPQCPQACMYAQERFYVARKTAYGISMRIKKPTYRPEQANRHAIAKPFCPLQHQSGLTASSHTLEPVFDPTTGVHFPAPDVEPP
jgi:hypothetical protein